MGVTLCGLREAECLRRSDTISEIYTFRKGICAFELQEEMKRRLQQERSQPFTSVPTTANSLEGLAGVKKYLFTAKIVNGNQEVRQPG